MNYVMPILSVLGWPVALVVTIGLAVWFGGAQVELSVGWRVLIIAAVAVGVFGFVGIRALLRWRRRKLIQAQLDHSAGIPAADRQPVVDQSLAARLQRLVEAWRKEDPLLLKRPWFLVLGPSGAGRSSLLSSSGSGLREAGELFASGEDGQRELSIWRGENAVYICPEGRSVDDQEGRGAFGELLAGLRGQRHGLDGVVLAIDLPRLIDAGEDEVASLARVMRARYDHVADRYGSVFPVYLTLTQCDQLHGFVDYFDHLDQAARADSLGLLLPYRRDQASAVIAGFGQRFDDLYHAVRQRRVSGLGAETSLLARERAAGFPVQFLAIRPRIELFLSELIGQRPSVETGLLRGVFFTSTVQAGTTRDRALGSWDPELAAGSGFHPVQVADQRSYFATGLLGQVLPRDGGLGYPRQSDAVRARRSFWIWASSSVAVAALLIAALAVSFVGNRNLLVQAANAARGLKPEHIGTVAAPMLLSELEPLRHQLMAFESWQQGEPESTPLHLRWGLYRGNQAYAAMRQGYYARIKPEFIEPAAALLAEDLLASSAKDGGDYQHYGRMFEQFYALAMLLGELPANERLAAILAGKGGYSTRPYWHQAVFAATGPESISPEVEGMALEHMAYLVGQARRAQEWRLGDATVHQAVMQTAKAKLGNTADWAHFSYSKLMRDVTATQEASLLLSLQRLLPPPGSDADRLFEYRDAPTELYSQDDFQGTVHPTMTATARQLQERFHALGDQSIDARLFEQEFLDRYTEAWTGEWRKGLSGLRIRPASSLRDALERLQLIAADGSPYADVLHTVARRQVLKVAGLDERNLPGFDPSGEWFSASRGHLNELSLAMGTYLSQARGGGLLGKIEQLQALATAVDKTRNDIDKQLLKVADTKARAEIARHLEGVLLMVVKAVGETLAAEADHLWQATIVDRFQASLGTQFPFARTAADSVSVADYQAFFDPEHGAVAEISTAVQACREVTALGKPIIDLGASYDDAVQRLATMGRLFTPGADGAPPSLALRVRLIQRPGVEDIRLSLGGSSVGLYDRPDHRGELAWRFVADQDARLAIRVERDRWLERRAVQDPWGVLRLIQGGQDVQPGSPVRVAWVIPREELAATPEPVAEPSTQPTAAPAPSPAAAPAAESFVHTAVAPDVVPDPDPAIDNPAKQQVGKGGRSSGPEAPDAAEPVAPNGYAGTAKTGGAIRIAPPKSVEPTAEPPPVATLEAYRVEVEFQAAGVDPGLFDLGYLGDYVPPATIRPGRGGTHGHGHEAHSH